MGSVVLAETLRRLCSTVALCAVWVFAGCASESGEPTQPRAISPVDKAEKPQSQNQNMEGVSPQVRVPEDVCQVSVTAGSQNSSGVDGVTVALPDTEQFKNAQLLYRLESTGSVVEVRAVVFSFSQFSSGDYTFELHPQDGKSCKVPVTIRPSDIESRAKLTLLITPLQ